MRLFYCICALGLLLATSATAAAAASAQASAQQPQPTTKPIGYTVFVRGTPLGREEVTVQDDATGTTITTQGRLAAPFNAVTRRAEVKYRPDGNAERFTLDASVNGNDVTLRTSFVNGTAQSEGNQGPNKISASHAVSPQAIVLPNGVFTAYTALARRLAAASAGTELRVYVLPLAEVGVRVVSAQSERMQVGTSFLDVRRYELVIDNPGGQLPVSLTTGEGGSLVRFSIPSQGLDVVREDVASPTSRTQVFSNPGDEAVVIPTVGFNLGATITKPKTSAAQVPVVILLSGSGAPDRDGVVSGIPTMAQLAGVFAEAGFLSVRFDKRGTGQSGGRAESATMQDYAEDTRAIVRWLLRRKDVDAKRIAAVGHAEGAWVALLAAARERRITAAATISAPSTTGAELILEQQQQSLDQMNLPPAEREQKVALQKQIHAAVMTGKGWDTIPRDERRAADTPWFQSLLQFDPARVLKDVRQPLLFVHGELDRQVLVKHADRLADVARKESDSKSVEVIIVRGVNHLLIPAFTGEVSEYSSLTDRHVSKDISGTVATWLTKTFAAIR